MPISVESGPSFAGIVNEGPVGPGFRLENTMPLTINRFNLTGEIRFNESQVEEVDSGSEHLPGSSDIPPVFVEAFDPDIKLKKIWDELTHQESPTPEMFHRAFLTAAAVGKSPQEFGWPRADLEYITEVLQVEGTQPETKVVNQHSQTLAHPVPLLVPIEQSIEKEEVVLKDEVDRSPHAVVNERVETKRWRFVLDERALGVVIVEISAAVRKAAALAQQLQRKITGALIDRFLPGQHPGNESEAVKGKGPDGSIPERKQAIKNHGEYATYAEAEEKSIKEAYEKPPIKVRKEGEGKPVKDEDIYRVFQDLEVKPLDYDVSEQLNATKVDVKTEPTVEDLGLAEVFDH